MERRDRSLIALSELKYIDSLDDYDRAPAIVRWMNKYITDIDVSKCIDLELSGLEELSELFYKNLNFLKSHKDTIKKELDQTKKIKAFIS
jgi:hypothetical protein